MKYANVDGQRREASPGLRGVCRETDAIVIAKCGKIREWHWALLPGSVKNRWKEHETEWHRKWKECFPDDWQEVHHRASNGERHCADIKTVHGRVIEFQHSPISEEERRSREEFYRPMYWVVNGRRLQRDLPRFRELLELGTVRAHNPLAYSVPMARCMLFRKWAGSRVVVFFDFGGRDLWALHPSSQSGEALVSPVHRKSFIDAVTKGERIKGYFKKEPERPRSVQQVVLVPGPRQPRPSRRKRYRSSLTLRRL